MVNMANNMRVDTSHTPGRDCMSYGFVAVLTMTFKVENSTKEDKKNFSSFKLVQIYTKLRLAKDYTEYSSRQVHNFPGDSSD